MSSSVKVVDGWLEGHLPGPSGPVWVRQFRQGPYESLHNSVPNLVLHTTETAHVVPELQYPSQWQVGEGYIGQHKPLGAKGEALRGDLVNDPWAMQVEMVAFSKIDVWLPPKSTLEPLVALAAWLHKQGRIKTALKRPRGWPTKIDKLPAAVEGYYRRNAGAWPTEPGVYGHIEIPGNTHWDPGSFDYPAFFDMVQQQLNEGDEDVRLDSYKDGQDRCLDKAKQVGGDPGPPPDNMDDPDKRDGWKHMRASLTWPKAP